MNTGKRTWLFATPILGLILLVSGCPEAPFGTVIVEDETGNKIASAWDKNFDGVADKDPVTGEVLLLLPKEAYAVADQVDKTVPMVLQIAGLFGVPFVTALGLFWKNRKLARFGIDVVESVQAGRQAVADDGAEGVLKVLDKAMGDAQTGTTRNMVSKIKDKELMPSVARTPG